MKTTIRLLNKDNRVCVHEFDTDKETDTDDILVWGPTNKHYLFHDQGTDANGAWEEWIEGRLVTVQARLSPRAS